MRKKIELRLTDIDGRGLIPMSVHVGCVSVPCKGISINYGVGNIAGELVLTIGMHNVDIIIEENEDGDQSNI